MNIYQKLNKCRCELQNVNIKKSGKNNYYQYFELSDFLPKINLMFEKENLFGAVSFDKDNATLTIIDTDKPEDKIMFSSPMADAKLPNCHPIQNMGAVETYQRRYLYLVAMEIVEADAIEPRHKEESKNPPPIPEGKEFEPPIDEPDQFACEDCGKVIIPTKIRTVEKIVENSQKYYQKDLCALCARERYEKDHPNAK